jgi:hypothetical protein
LFLMLFYEPPIYVSYEKVYIIVYYHRFNLLGLQHLRI